MWHSSSTRVMLFMQIVCGQIIELVYDICSTTFNHHALVVHNVCYLTLLRHHVAIVAKFTNNCLSFENTRKLYFSIQQQSL